MCATSTSNDASACSDIEQTLVRCARFGVKPGLESIRSVCATMGDPQNATRVVHIAGTNGKGATCALMDSALRAAGYRTGRYTSPHLIALNERFSVNGEPASDEQLADAFACIPADAIERLTYFELLTATAFALYRSEKVDWLVLETGLGGRLDATNIVESPAVCVITRIGLDHCEWLGHTVAEIAAEKGGIIKSRVPVVLGAMPDDARAVLEQIAAERHAPCTFAPDAVERDSGTASRWMAALSALALKGDFNRENAATAFAALEVLGVEQEAVERGFASAEWPGRYQRIECGGKRFLVDGAHNPPAMRALVDSLKEEMSRDGIAVNAAICGFCGDKDVTANLKTLREVVDCGFAVPIRNPRTLPPERTAELMRAAGFRSVRSCASLRDALDMAPSGTVVCGSLFLAGEALAELGYRPFRSARFTPNEMLRPKPV